MIHDPSAFDTRAFDSRFFDLGPYEIDDVERVTIRRGQPARAALPARDHLTGDEIGILAVAGAAVGTVIAFAIDAQGAAEALRAMVGL